jgi:transcriptional regulator with XRE-family HTH domain
MNTSEPFRSLDMDAAAADPSLAGYRLAQLRKAQNITAEQQAEALGIDRERLTTLCSCRLPRGQAELELIAARMGWEVGRLAGLLGVRYTGEGSS